MCPTFIGIADVHGLVEPRIVTAVIGHQRDEFDERYPVILVDEGRQASGDELPFPGLEQVGRRPHRRDPPSLELTDHTVDLRVGAHEDRDVARFHRPVRELRCPAEEVDHALGDRFDHARVRRCVFALVGVGHPQFTTSVRTQMVSSRWNGQNDVIDFVMSEHRTEYRVRQFQRWLT